MILLGIDPGSIRTGYAFIHPERDKLKVLEYGVIHNPAHHPLPQRIFKIFSELSKLLQNYKPNSVALETAFVAKYAQPALILGHARGAIMAAVGQQNLPLSEYEPRLVKKVLTGRGGASKAQITHLVQHIYGLKLAPTPADAADALAIAYCHLVHLKKPGN